MTDGASDPSPRTARAGATAATRRASRRPASPTAGRPTETEPRARDGGGGLARVGRPAWMVLGTLLLVAVLFLFVFPTRAYLAQQRELDQARDDLATLRQQNELLADEAERLRDPEEIERIARERFHFVMPGEQAFSVVPAPSEPDDAAEEPRS